MVDGIEDESGEERLAANAEREKEAWARTLADMNARTEAYEAENWETVAVPAGHTAATHPEAGSSDRFGFVHTVPGNYAEELRAAIESRQFPEYDVFRARTDGRVFLVTELLDPDSGTVILVAGSYELRTVGPLIAAADEAGVCYTHLRTLDGTLVGSFEHEEYEKFVPRIESFRD
jgi:hypothetical protein